MDVAEILTERLRLVPLGLSEARALLHGQRLRGSRYAPGYPTDGTFVAAGLVVAAVEAGATVGPFRTYQVVRRDSGLVVGDCGFHGPPDADGVVHVAHSVAEVEQGHRDAAEAVEALIGWARTQPAVTRVVADAARTNIAAIRVMERAGMRRVDADDDFVYYEG